MGCTAKSVSDLIFSRFSPSSLGSQATHTPAQQLWQRRWAQRAARSQRFKPLETHKACPGQSFDSETGNECVAALSMVARVCHLWLLGIVGRAVIALLSKECFPARAVTARLIGPKCLQKKVRRRLAKDSTGYKIPTGRTPFGRRTSPYIADCFLVELKVSSCHAAAENLHNGPTVSLTLAH